MSGCKLVANEAAMVRQALGSSHEPGSGCCGFGAAGFVGRYVVRELLSRGLAVRASRTRDSRKAAGILPRNEKLTLVSGDGTDTTSLASLVTGVQACVNCVGILREAGGGQTSRKCTSKRRARWSRPAAARAFGGSCRFRPWASRRRASPATSRASTRQSRSCRRSGLDWTILRPGLIHGKESGFITLAKGWVKGEKQPWIFLPYFSRGVLTSDVPLAAIRREAATVAPVAVEDVASAVAECLKRAESTGEIYNLVGSEELTWPDLLRAIRDNVPGADVDLEPLGIPSEFAAVQAKVAGAIGLGGLLPFDEGMALMGGSDSTANLDKAA